MLVHEIEITVPKNEDMTIEVHYYPCYPTKHKNSPSKSLRFLRNKT